MLGSAPTWELVEVASKATSRYCHAFSLRIEAGVQRRALEGDGATLALGLDASIPTPQYTRDVASELDVGITTCQLALNEVEELAAGASRTGRRFEIALAASAHSQTAKPKDQPGAVEATAADAAGKLAATFSAEGAES